MNERLFGQEVQDRNERGNFVRRLAQLSIRVADMRESRYTKGAGNGYTKESNGGTGF